MEMWRRWHEGRLAELLGPAAFDSDARTRLMMFRGPWDASEWTSYHPEGEAIFTAYAKGINAFIEQNADNLPVEFKLTGISRIPGPRRRSCCAGRRSGSRAFAVTAINEIAAGDERRALRGAGSEPAGHAGPVGRPRGAGGPRSRRDYRGRPRDRRARATAIRSTGDLPALEIVEPYKALMPEVRRRACWPVDSGGCREQQLGRERHACRERHSDRRQRPAPPIEMPALRYFTHLVAPGWNVIGGSEPPFVGVNAGHNERMAWGFTFAGTDMVDLYVEELHPANPNQVAVERRLGADARHPRGDPGQGGSAAQRRAQVQPARPGVLRGRGEPACVRGTLRRPGTGNRRLSGQLQARSGGQLQGLLRSGDVLESAHAQPDLRRRRETSPCRCPGSRRTATAGTAGFRSPARESTSGRASAPTCPAR